MYKRQTIYFAGIAGLLLYNMGSAILRAVGDSRRPLYFLCFSAVNNIIFDLLFVLACGWGVAGVAYATILSQFLSALLVLYSPTHDNAAYGIRWREPVSYTHLGLPGPVLVCGQFPPPGPHAPGGAGAHGPPGGGGRRLPAGLRPLDG